MRSAGSNLFVAPAAGFHAFGLGDLEVLRVSQGGAAVSSLVVNGTDLRVPVGGAPARPAGTDGQNFYNTDTKRFEGYAASAWSSLGGTMDVNQDTYISAENYPGANND